MITDKQFNDAFTAAGGAWIAKYYVLVSNWRKSNDELIDKIFSEGTDSKRTGTNVRVSSLNRILANDRGEEALRKIAESKRIDLDAVELASEILRRGKTNE